MIVYAIALTLQPAPSGTDAPYAVVRLGDGRLSCEAIVSEVNALSLTVREQMRSVAQRGVAVQTGAAHAEIAAGAASSVLPFGGDLISAAASTAGRTAIANYAKGALDERTSLQGPMDRIEHLEKLAIEKQC